MTKKEYALFWLRQGINVIPNKGETKEPAIKFKHLENKLIAEKEVEDWWKFHPDDNLAMITGPTSGVMVLDFDKKYGGMETFAKYQWPKTFTINTPGEGKHLWFKWKKGYPNDQYVLPGVELKSNMLPSTLPGSTREGKSYEIEDGADGWFARNDLADLPDFIKPKRQATNGDWEKLIAEKVPAGQRNNASAKVAGLLLKYFPPRKWDIAWMFFSLWAANMCEPPIERSEARRTFKGLADKEFAVRKAKEVKIFSAQDLAKLPAEEQEKIIRENLEALKLKNKI